MTANRCRLFSQPSLRRVLSLTARAGLSPACRVQVRWPYQAALQLCQDRSMIDLRRGEIEPPTAAPACTPHEQ